MSERGAEHRRSSPPRRQELLGRLIRFNTVNPPGNERAAQEYLLGASSARPASSASCSAREPERPNLVARLRGARAGPDAVLPRPRRHGAREPRRSGRTTRGRARSIDGFVWGRGAIDMKSQIAAEVVAACVARARRLAPGARRAADRRGRRRGDRRRARRAVADREPSREGALRLLVNEGGGEVVRVRRAGAATASAAPRRASSASPCTPTASAAHASLPHARRQRAAEDGAAARALRRTPALVLADARSREAFLRGARRGLRGDAGARRSRACAPPTRASRTSSSRCSAITFSPTRIRASEKINVIPSEARAEGRLPRAAGPRRGGRAPRDRAVLDEGRRAPGRATGSSSPSAYRATARRSTRELMDVIARVDRRARPGRRGAAGDPARASPTRGTSAPPSPSASPTASSRSAHQSLFETSPLVHGADERIDVRDLAFATEFFRDLALRVLG